MQTRREKYRKYREEIRHTPDSSFAKYQRKESSLDEEDLNLLDLVDSPSSAIGYGSLMEKIGKEDFAHHASPYRAYIQRRRNRIIFKCVLLLIAIVLMVIWFVYMEGRK